MSRIAVAIFAGLALCAAAVLFSAQPAQADGPADVTCRSFYQDLPASRIGGGQADARALEGARALDSTMQRWLSTELSAPRARVAVHNAVLVAPHSSQIFLGATHTICVHKPN